MSQARDRLFEKWVASATDRTFEEWLADRRSAAVSRRKAYQHGITNALGVLPSQLRAQAPAFPAFPPFPGLGGLGAALAGSLGALRRSPRKP